MTARNALSAAAALALCAGSAFAQCNPSQLLASNRASSDLFGTSVALTTDNSNNPILFVGAPGHDETGADQLGDVYVFNNNGSFFQAQQILPSFGSGNYRFGSAMSASFPYLAVSAPGGGIGGLVYVYQKVGNSWTTIYSYEPIGAMSNADFGYSVGVTDSPTPRVIAGAPGWNTPSLSDSGAFFIHQNTGSWAVQSFKTSADFAGQALDHLGNSVAIDNALCAAGATDGDTAGVFDSGYAVVGKLGANNQWTFTRVNPPTPQPSAHFGFAVAVNDASHLLAVSAVGENTSANDQGGAQSDVGAVYVFDVSGAPTLIARLLPDNPTSGMQFGKALAFSADRLLISAPNTHQVFEFRRNVGGSFTQRSVMTRTTANTNFAASIALSNNLAVVGDDLNDVAPTNNQGAAYDSYLFSGMGGDSFDAALECLVGSNGNYACTNAMTPSALSLGNCGNNGGTGNDAWFTFVPACTGQITLDTVGSSFDTVITVHDAKPTTLSTHNVGCNDDIITGSNLQSLLTLNVTGGQRYWARVAGYSASASGDAYLNISNVTAPNDDCAFATVVSPGTTLGSTCPATNSIFNALSCSGLSRTFNKDVWFDFTPDTTGVYDITTCGSSFDTLLAVYPSCPGANVLPIACNDDATGCESLRSSVSPSLTAGVSYKIRLGGYNAAAFGDYALNITEQAPPCDPDVNQDGVSDQGDVDYLINVIAGGPNPANIDPDINHDGVADQGDIDALINVIAGAPCP